MRRIKPLVGAARTYKVEVGIQHDDSITTRAKYKRQLVDARTGVLTSLTGDELAAARASNSVVPRSTYYNRKSKLSYLRRQNRLVYADTGEDTQLIGDELSKAIAKELVIKWRLYKSRARKKIWVDANTGQKTKLTGDAFEVAQQYGQVILKSTYQKRQLVDAKTGQPTQLQAEQLESAIRNETVITKSKYYQYSRAIKILNGTARRSSREACDGGFSVLATVPKARRSLAALEMTGEQLPLNNHFHRFFPDVIPQENPREVETYSVSSHMSSWSLLSDLNASSFDKEMAVLEENNDFQCDFDF